jgi:hypothetical protein
MSFGRKDKIGSGKENGENVKKFRNGIRVNEVEFKS